MALIGLLSLVLLVAFTMLYLASSIASKPKFMEDAIAFMTARLQQISFFGAIYALIAAALYVLLAWDHTTRLVGLFANVLIILMALPHAFEQIAAKFEGKINAAILEESRATIGFVTRREKVFGYIGAATALVLFAVVFR